MPGMLVRHRTCRCCPGLERGVARRREERDWRRTEWEQTKDIEVVSCDAECPCPWGIDVYERTTVVQDWAAATRGMGTRVYL